jgi:hypothetical protein
VLCTAPLRPQVVDYVVGFDDMGGSLDCETSTIADRLVAAGVLHPNDRATYKKAAPAGSQQPKGRSVRTGIYQKADSDEDSDFD